VERPEYEKTYELEDSYWWFVGRRRLVQTLLEQPGLPARYARILDVGCGTGGNLEFLTRWGNGVGVDLSPLPLEFARRRHLSCLSQASGLALPYAEGVFDLVTAFDVLYHRWITDDTRALGECFRVLRPGGWLLITDSALPALWSQHDEIYCARQRYTLDNIRSKLHQAGLTLHKLSYTNALLLPVAFVVRSGPARRVLARWFPSAGGTDLVPLPGWINRVLTGILSLEALWLRRGTFPAGSSLIGLAQKPIR
jgi:SAM-dependent methyltransferase